MFSPALGVLQQAQQVVYRYMQPTLSHAWPLLQARLQMPVIVKHENHTPAGAFKVRGGLTYFDALKRHTPGCSGVISATRGNHGQSVGIAAKRHGMSATIVVPHGNSTEKNAAMRALGITLIEHGDDFQESREHAGMLARTRGLHMVPSFHSDLLLGVASYWLELFEARPDINRVYVPIGMGSGACAAVIARDALKRDCEIVGVVSAHAQAYALSFTAGRVIDAPATTKLADGMACRSPDASALEILCAGLTSIVQVTDDEVADAMRIYFSDTHNVAEGAGAAPLAAALQDLREDRIQRSSTVIGLPLCGGNVDTAVFAEILSNKAGS
jgi:threonine dehydratase